MRFRALVGGEEREVEVTPLGEGRYRIAFDGEVLQVSGTIGDDGTIRFTEGDQWHRAAGHANGSGRQLWVEGRTFAYEVLRGAAASAAAHEHDLTSPAPGLVAEVHAAAGQVVTKGEKLVVLESMKMFFPVLAPHDGVVSRVMCSVGETVDAGVLLIELADPEGPGG